MPAAESCDPPVVVSCHNDNGVASSTRLKFPLEGGAAAGIAAALIDRAKPTESRLLTLPTNRVPHPGGERIKRGSPEEETWNSRSIRAACRPGA